MLTAPTRDQFVTRYPSFSTASPALIDELLQEALSAVDESWIERDRVPALLAYAAHLLAVELYGNPVMDMGNGQAVRVSGPLTSAAVGSVNASFGGGGNYGSSGGSGGMSASVLASTPYGARYLELLRRSKPPVLVV